MLGSITRLGESGRNARWWVTVTWFGFGALAAGALAGAAMGLAGSGLAGILGGRGAALMLGLLAAAGLGLDIHLAGLRLPSVTRQVDETWLARYRGWVYGVGFGFQLGLGVVTIVTSSAVYLALAAALLTGSPAAGLLIGATFGAVRAASVLPGGWVHRPPDLFRVDGLLRRWEQPVRRGALAGHAAVLAGLVAVLVWP